MQLCFQFFAKKLTTKKSSMLTNFYFIKREKYVFILNAFTNCVLQKYFLYIQFHDIIVLNFIFFRKTDKIIDTFPTLSLSFSRLSREDIFLQKYIYNLIYYKVIFSQKVLEELIWLL